MKNKTNEIVLLVITLVAITVLLLTRKTDMSSAVSYMLIGFFALGVIGYGVYIWLENPADERESQLLMVASKHAYLVSSFIMGIGIVVQSLDHTLDIWLPLALGSTVVVKLVSFFIHRKEQE